MIYSESTLLGGFFFFFLARPQFLGPFVLFIIVVVGIRSRESLSRGENDWRARNLRSCCTAMTGLNKAECMLLVPQVKVPNTQMITPQQGNSTTV